MLDHHEKRYLTPSEVAEFLMVSPVTVRAWAHKGLLESRMTPGGHRRFLREDIEQFAREQQANGRSRTKRRPARVLIIDEHEAQARLLSDLLARHGVRSETARNGFEAGLKFHRFRPDLVLLDLLMPGLDGFATCAQIKTTAETCMVRVIAMTGFDTPERTQRILAAGAECCLSKPLDQARLFEVLGWPLPARADEYPAA